MSGAGILAIHHVQVTVPAARMAAALTFYGGTLGLAEIPQQPRDQPEAGAWYRVGAAELHLRPEAPGADAAGANATRASRRHVAFAVADLDPLERALAAAGVEFLPDARPVPGQRRLFVRDPGGNRVELMERPRPSAG